MKSVENNKKSNIEEHIKEILDELRFYLSMHGGDLEYIRYENNYVYVRMTGSCYGCELQEHTLNDAIFESLRIEITEIKGVINVDL